jgi:hypothetical protein
MRTTTVDLSLELSDQMREQFRWYFEDYLQYPEDPAPTIADRVVEEMKQLHGSRRECVCRRVMESRAESDAVTGCRRAPT